MSERPLRILSWLAAVLVSIALILAWTHRITGAPVEDDAAQLVQMALNLEHHGVISLDKNPPFNPTNYREPMPVWVTALGIKLVDGAMGEAPRKPIFTGSAFSFLNTKTSCGWRCCRLAHSRR